MSAAQGQNRKSSRVMLLEAIKASKEESKKNAIASEGNTPQQAQANARKKAQKRKKLSEVGIPPNPKVEKEPKNENPPPEKNLLEFAIEVLQRRDPDDYFGKPVDPKEVEYYYEVIKEPMDFGTIKAKIREGSYKNLKQFEYDVDLISENAMHFNGAETVYFRKARAIKELAKKVMDQLKTNPEGLKSKFSPQGSKKGCNGVGTSRSTSGTKRQKRGSGSNGSGNRNFGRRDTYVPWSTDKSIILTVYNSAKRLVPGNGGIGYKESLTRFVKELGPTAAKVAAKKLAQCLTQPQTQPPSRQFIQQPPPQVPVRPFTSQLPPLPTRSFMVQQPQGPACSFVGPDSLIPRRPTGIVIGRQAPPVTRRPIIGANDKGKGILVDDGIDISAGTLRRALGGHGNGLLGDGNSVVVVDGEYRSGFFKQMLNFDNDAMGIIDTDPQGGMSAQPDDLATIQSNLMEERTRANRDAVAANTFSQPQMAQGQHSEQDDLLLQVFKNHLGSAPNAGFEGFNLPGSRHTYPAPPARTSYRPYSSLLEFGSRQSNRPRPSVYPSRVIMPSRLSQTNGYTNPSYGAGSAQRSQLPGRNSHTQWGSQPVNDYSNVQPQGVNEMEFSAPSPYDQNIMRLLDLDRLPARLASPSVLLGAQARQERQHASTSHVHPSVNNPVGQGVWQQRGQHDDAGNSNRVDPNAHQEPQHPSVGGNLVGQGSWQDQGVVGPEYRFVENPPIVYSRRRHHNRNQGGGGQAHAGSGVGAGEAYGGPAAQQGQQQQQQQGGGGDQQHLMNFRQHYPDLALHLGAKPPPSF